MRSLFKLTVLVLLVFNLSCSSKKTEHKVTTTETVQTKPSIANSKEVSEAPATTKTVVKEEVKEETSEDVVNLKKHLFSTP